MSDGSKSGDDEVKEKLNQLQNALNQQQQEKQNQLGDSAKEG